MSPYMSVIEFPHLPKINFYILCSKLSSPQHDISCQANVNSSPHLIVGPRAFQKHMALDRKEEFF